MQIFFKKFLQVYFQISFFLCVINNFFIIIVIIEPLNKERELFVVLFLKDYSSIFSNWQRI